jgi:ribonuclease P protein component
VLPRAHRIVDGEDLRRVSRKGRRTATPYFVAAVLATSDEPSRFGFVVSKAVGGAVVRNRVKRRLRNLAAESVKSAPLGKDVVIRALPPAATASFEQLSEGWAGVFGP